MMDDNTMEECFICFEETDQFIFFECTHKVCAQCFPRLESRCPICERSVPEIMISVPETTPVPERCTVYHVTRWRTILFLCTIIVIVLWYNHDVIF
jgi:hypothetical protein